MFLKFTIYLLHVLVNLQVVLLLVFLDVQLQRLGYLLMLLLLLLLLLPPP